mgnify:CR=1 FL=1
MPSDGASVPSSDAFFASKGDIDTASTFSASTNVLALSNGKGNVQARWNLTDRFAGLLGWKSYAQKQGNRPKILGEVTVERSQYFLGTAYSVWGREKRFDILIIPAIGFGSETDPVNVDNRSGVSLGALGQWRLGNHGQMILEAGILADNLDGEMKGDGYLGTGFQF